MCLSPMEKTRPPIISGFTAVFMFSDCPFASSFSSAALAEASSAAVSGCGAGEQEAL